MNTTDPTLSISQQQYPSWKWWGLAARPKTLVAAAIPVIAASTLAFVETTTFSWLILFSALSASFLIQIGTNLTNDALDFRKGADTPDRLGPVRVTQMGILSFSQVLGAGFFSFFLSLLFGLPLIAQGGFPIFLLLIASIVSGYIYTGGPYPLAYIGLGDLFVFLFFGCLSSLGTYYLQTLTVGFSSLLLGVQLGCLATALLAVNNLRDVQGDKKAHKQTLAVRYGVRFARWEITLFLLFPFVLNILWAFLNHPFAAVLPFAALPIAVWIVLSVWRHEPSELYNRFLSYTALLHGCFGLLLTIGFFL